MSGDIRLSPKHGLNPMVGQCPLCAGPGNELFLLGRLPDDAEAPRTGVVPGMSQPCRECVRLMDMGFLLIVCRDGTQSDPYRTGEMHVVNTEAALRIFGADFVKRGVAFIEESAARKIGIEKPTPESDATG